MKKPQSYLKEYTVKKIWIAFLSITLLACSSEQKQISSPCIQINPLLSKYSKKNIERLNKNLNFLKFELSLEPDKDSLDLMVEKDFTTISHISNHLAYFLEYGNSMNSPKEQKQFLDQNAPIVLHKFDSTLNSCFTKFEDVPNFYLDNELLLDKMSLIECILLIRIWEAKVKSELLLKRRKLSYGRSSN